MLGDGAGHGLPEASSAALYEPDRQSHPRKGARGVVGARRQGIARKLLMPRGRERTSGAARELKRLGAALSPA
jgi:hypothetical protein